MLYYSKKLCRFYETEEAAFEAEHNMPEYVANPNPIVVANAFTTILYSLPNRMWKYCIEIPTNETTGDAVGVKVDVELRSKD